MWLYVNNTKINNHNALLKMVPKHSRTVVKKSQKAFKIASFKNSFIFAITTRKPRIYKSNSTHDVIVLHVKIGLIDRTFCNMNLMNVAEPVIESVAG